MIDKFSRRTFLQTTALTGTATALSGAARLSALELERRQFIFVWLRGGLSPRESFDPKPHAAAEIRGESTPIATTIPGVSFTEHFPRLAQRATKLCLVRGLVPANDRHGLAEASLLTGVSAASAEQSPQASYGSWLANEFGTRDGMWPHFQIGHQIDRRYGGGGAGQLPWLTAPIVVPSHEESSSAAVQDFCFPGDVSFQRLVEHCGPRPSLSRFESAWRLASNRLQQLHASDSNEPDVRRDQLAAAAHRWHVSAALRELLDLHRESPAQRAMYGATPVGDDFLQARRLIEAGARCVTVTNGGWDHHANIASEMRQRGPQLDAALAGLLDDLDQRGLLAMTTIACLTDFGRTPRLNQAGGREHWPHTGLCLLAGAGTPQGQCLGATDREGLNVIDSPLSPTDLGNLILNHRVS
jgi:uncharacterized protein (DUF1501 family)